MYPLNFKHATLSPVYIKLWMCARPQVSESATYKASTKNLLLEVFWQKSTFYFFPIVESTDFV